MGVEFGPRTIEQRGVDVALDGSAPTEQCDCLIERSLRIDPHDICPGITHGHEQVAGARAEVDARHTDVGDLGEDGGGVRLHVSQVVLDAQRAGPRIEQLQGAGPGEALGAKEGPGGASDPGQQRIPHVGLLVHEGFGDGVVPAGSALDEIGRDGEGRTREPDERGVAEQFNRPSDSLGDGREGLGVELRQGGDRGGRADRVVDDRAHAGDDVDAHASQTHRNHDVGEEDSRVDAMATHRLAGDLGGQLRRETGIEHGRVAAGRAVFGQRATGLAHHPDRPSRGAFTAIGAHED
ncbi:MAG: hypothetical protein BWY91_02663 [bacterium ADurb.BinA028]|nr:MAG: hypothetical protein BWY91_02663 [bacterium ADurb.BinA028]